ncbi:MAG: hypothetical protein ACSLFJ_11990 [Immundisolibacter sp.]|uniref:hypothetical protein n=1 Tax=Immundisolibacter sp. TaxID=1934948 RepID=UPI003EE02AE2
MMLTGVAWVAAVTERDMDILLLEEIHVSEPFRTWLTRCLCPDAGPKVEFVGAWHSLREAKLGETDLLFAFRDSQAKTWACFLEDKIDAVFTDRQAQRYSQHRDRLIASGQCAIAITCLVAPQRYIDTHPEEAAIFDRVMSYEDIRDQIGSQGGIRAEYRARFIQEAIDENRRGYVPNPDEDVTAFWRSYYAMSVEQTPELKMKPPASRPASSGFFYFVDCVPKGVEIVHKTRFDAVDLQFARTDVKVLARCLGEDALDPGMAFVQASASAAIRIKVPTVVLSDPFEPHAEAVKVALDSASRLLRFFEAHAKTFAPLLNTSCRIPDHHIVPSRSPLLLTHEVFRALAGDRNVTDREVFTC